jgi:kynureninase
MAVHLTSLEIFHRAGGVSKLREKSLHLTEFLTKAIEEVNQKNNHLQLTIITPKNPKERGCQLSILTGDNGKAIFDHLCQNDIIADWREPNVIRMAPTPLYNTFSDIFRLYEVLGSYS